MSHILGQTLGERYRIVSLLGSGGMGEVYLAEHVVLGKRMAVKVLKSDFTRDEEFVRRFQQEAVAASRIGHENIVSVTDFGRTPAGAFYFVMEVLWGNDLAALLRTQGAPSLTRALPILIQVSRALGAAHAEGIVHRDLKAENVMILPRDDGTDLVKVLDFGISKMAAAGENPRITRQGVVMGTPYYMAPEQARGEAVDARGDIYSLGVVAYELLTGTVPFDAPNLTGVLLKHMTEAPEPPWRRKPGLTLPPELEALVLKMLEKDPAKRPQSMVEVRDVLVRASKQSGGEVATAPAINAPAPIPLTTPSASSPAGLDRTWVAAKPRRRAVPLLLGLVGVAAAGAGALLLLRPPQQQAPVLASPPAPAPTPVVVTAPPMPTPPVVAPPPEVPTPPTLSTAPAPPHRITVKDVQRVFGRSSAKLRKCLQENRGALPGRTGAISVSFTVVRSGTVKAAKVTTPGAGDGPLAQCVTARVQEMKFPAHPENAVAFEIPLAYDFKD